ncbi:LOW QUALITY PROTEIN: MAP7 domain-containing protein 3 [Rhineura floridana]|uniref:LOW QUALITY PROTEIN: MAP7 domain-containing protein 3 n=1 Tax=Rhineura floridana TaxID=261503 RepID=UPI002AC8582C|nr:LOW QUALITY PROTEIN: MAP7 domain-containing protein 3 [Rhineura floridana]
MAEGNGAAPPAPLAQPPPPLPSLKGLREQMVAAAQALAEERRNQSGVSPVPVQSPVGIKSSTKPVIDGSTLRTEERQRLARERREEREKQHAAKETQILEKEKKAKLQYEKQIEEKQRRLREQKLKEQQRRAAVEEKRKQKIEEEQERYEAVVHRTLERSQRLETRQKRWSWGGSVTDSDGKTESLTTGEASKRSTSAANLKQAETVINKRLSSSAALLNSASKGSTKRSASLNRLNNKVPLNSEQPVSKALQVEQKGETEKKRSSSLNRMSSKPQSSSDLENVQKEEKAARRSQFSAVESNVISRLLAPTQASLARSKSAATLSADGKDPSASNSSINSPVHAPKVPVRSRSTDRLKVAASSSENVSLDSAQKSEAAKQSLASTGRCAPSPSLPGPRRSLSPASMGKRPPSPAATRQKPHPTSPKRQWPPSPIVGSKPAPIQRPSLTPNVLNVSKKKADLECKPKERVADPAGQEPGGGAAAAASDTPASERELPAVATTKTKEDASSKAVPGTTTAEEAARILAEKRRLAREQRDREDQERVQREEEERIRKEETAKRALEEQAQLEEALRELEEERRLEEEEQQRLAKKERIRREQEEKEKLAELQLQREEAEAKALEEAEKQRQERERIMQQNMQERLERKKRIEEIMRRTRKAEQNEAKNEDKSNEEDEGVEEDEEMGLEKQDQPEKANYDDSFLEEGPEVVCNMVGLKDGSIMEPDDVFVNGEEQEEVDPRNDGVNSMYFTQTREASPPAKETVVENSENLHVNEADHPVGFISNLNGKSEWNFEEIIDLGIHPKTTRLSSDNIAADSSTQNFKEATTVPASPKLAFEEESSTNSLTKPIETASEL